MPPSRRKGGKKAAAAAACSQFKVGDLVLAKVKGFPVWPATFSFAEVWCSEKCLKYGVSGCPLGPRGSRTLVDEPQKWGYSADRKKEVIHYCCLKMAGVKKPMADHQLPQYGSAYQVFRGSTLWLLWTLGNGIVEIMPQTCV
ncbi:unnamed protein product [Sphenostylis stenocarpa]|uniref:PWWP domain-containing protein n=1 Tax=Sphenostylis stenocarpa TaxID=92480 RepID=A0AA86V360_9FABA|nr:unnamed protein product [Sphenostylis stenocarpa]